jgi:hypothetical protein
MEKMLTAILTLSLSLQGCADRIATVEKGDVPGKLVVARPAGSNPTSNFKAGMHEIDKLFPGPSIPEILPATMSVQAVTDDALLELGSSTLVGVDGVTCSTSGALALRRILVNAETRVAYVSAPATYRDRKKADFWMITFLDLPDRRLPAYTALAEAAITSGWCEPDESSNSQYLRRYVAIKDLRNSLR